MAYGLHARIWETGSRRVWVKCPIGSIQGRGGTLYTETGWQPPLTFKAPRKDTMTDLLPMPEPDTHCWDDDTGKDVWSYSAEQVRAYAIAHRLAERERCIDICNQYFTIEGIAQDIASAIRGTA
jgi:hypothetical protein